MKQVISAVCISCGAEHEAIPTITTCKKCGGLLDIKYDYSSIRSNYKREELKTCTDQSMWRYRAFLPIEADSQIPKLRVGGSPFYKAERMANLIGLNKLYIKDDGINPTASLKDRASAMAVVKAEEAGASTICCSSTGNAASSLAGNAAAAGFESVIFVPSRAPKGKVSQLMIFGAKVISVDGTYEETFELSQEAIAHWGWYNRNAAINPYLLEGKKTVAFEIAEQLSFQITDYVAVSVGDGCTISGVWKGFKDLYEAGWIERLPKLISVQASGCCPLNRSINEAKPWTPMEENTLADSIAVGVPRNPDKALCAIKESGGIAVEVTDEEILNAMRQLGRTCGVFGEPAGAAATAGVMKAVSMGLIKYDESVTTIVTGNGLKDTANAIKAAGEPLLIKPDIQILLNRYNELGIS
ncbi:MAG: threonine synthase [Clostridia bacterium]|nr:threonine synthase [Clostridia bacterium]